MPLYNPISISDPLSSWVTSTSYAVGDDAIESTKLYSCLIAHTSGTFATDLGASKWVEISSGAGSLNGLTDSLIETDSLWLGSSPTATTDTAQYNIGVGLTALDSITTGDKNVSIGYNALTANTTGLENVAVGSSASAGTTATTYGVFVGCNAGLTGAGAYNVAVGHNAGYTMGTSATGNTLLGRSAGSSIDSGTYNTLLGFNAGDNLTTGDNNIIIGYAVDASAVGVDNELRIGKQAVISIGANLATGAVTFNSAYTFPTAVTGSNDYVLTAQTDGSTAWAAAGGGGASALNDLSDCETGSTSLFVGTTASDATTLHNTGTGILALDAIASGAYGNTAMGYSAGTAISTGDENACFGSNAGLLLSTGSYNTFIGAYAGDKVTNLTQCTFIGNAAGGNLDDGAHYNTYIGLQAGKGGTTATGTYNTAVGWKSMIAIEEGHSNAALGMNALNAVSSGSENIGIGRDSGDSITTGDRNVAIGYASDCSAALDSQIAIGNSVATTQASSLIIGQSGQILLHGDFGTAAQTKLGINLGNTFTAPTATLHVKGQGATYATVPLLIEDSAGAQLMKLTDAGDNIAIGKNALDTVTGGSGLNNVAFGLNAGTAISTGDNNTVIGERAGYALNTGTDNVIAGFYAGTTITNSVGNVFLGYRAGSATASDSTGKNVAIGYYAMGSGNGNAKENVCIGHYAGSVVSSGDFNLLIGRFAGNTISTGERNIVLGNYTGGVGVSTGSYNIMIGDAAGAANADNQIAIGKSIVTTAVDQINIGGNITGLMTASDRHTKFVGQTYTALYALSDGATITPDFKDGNVQTVTIADNRTIANPTNIKAGATYILIVRQDGTGSRTISWGSKYKFAGGSAPTLTTTANRADVITIVAYSTDFLVCTSTLNFVVS